MVGFKRRKTTKGNPRHGATDGADLVLKVGGIKNDHITLLDVNGLKLFAAHLIGVSVRWTHLKYATGVWVLNGNIPTELQSAVCLLKQMGKGRRGGVGIKVTRHVLTGKEITQTADTMFPW